MSGMTTNTNTSHSYKSTLTLLHFLPAAACVPGMTTRANSCCIPSSTALHSTLEIRAGLAAPEVKVDEAESDEEDEAAGGFEASGPADVARVVVEGGGGRGALCGLR